MHKEIYLTGTIEENNVFEVIKEINIHIEEDSKKAKSERKDIRLNIHSHGGECEVGIALCDFLRDINENRESPVYVHTYVLRTAQSMAFPIWLCGKERTLSRSAVVMYHDLAYGYMGSLEKQKEYVDVAEEIIETIDKIIVSKTSLTAEDLKKIRDERKDKYFSREEALGFLR